MSGEEKSIHIEKTPHQNLTELEPVSRSRASSLGSEFVSQNVRPNPGEAERLQAETTSARTSILKLLCRTERERDT